jgi:hypothetical protein
MAFIIEDRNLYARASSTSHQFLISNDQSVVLCMHDAGEEGKHPCAGSILGAVALTALHGICE